MKNWKKCMVFLATILCIAQTGCGTENDKADERSGNNQTEKEEQITVKDLSGASEDEAWEYAEEVIKEIRGREPQFGDYQVSIADFGAVASETDAAGEDERKLAQDNTRAIYKAVCDVNSQKFGGTVIVPAGTWYTAAIHLKSNVNLHLEEGAVLKFATDTDLYAGELMEELYGNKLTFVRSGGIELYNYSPFIYAYKADNIAITGSGTIDGQASGTCWIPWRTLGEPEASNYLLGQAENGVPVEERLYGESEEEPGTATDGYIRPNLIELIDCDNVLLEDFTTANSPAWQLHPVYCNYVTIRGVNINSLMANNDGIDPDSCKYVIIEENIFNTGDDCIAVKSGKNADGRRVGIASENIVIQNNTMQEGHGGITLGSEASAGIRNVFARNNHMESPAQECCLRFKNSTLRGNVLENIFYKDTYVSAFKNTRDMIVFQSDYGAETETQYLESAGIEIKKYAPVTRHVYINGFYAAQENASTAFCATAVSMTGTADSPVSDVHLKNIEVSRPDVFLKASYVDGLTLEDAVITRNRKKDTFEQCSDITFKNVTYAQTRQSALEDYSVIENFQSENVRFETK